MFSILSEGLRSSRPLVPVAIEGGDQPLGFVKSFDFIVYVQFSINVFRMLLHGVHTQVQGGGNFFAAFAFRYPVKNLHFSRTKGRKAGLDPIGCRCVHTLVSVPQNWYTNDQKSTVFLRKVAPFFYGALPAFYRETGRKKPVAPVNEL